MKSTLLPELHYWSAYQPDRRIDFNGFFLAGVAGGVLIDPLSLDEPGLDEVQILGGARWILVTNADHWRDSGRLAGQLGARILAPVDERLRLGERASLVQDWFGPEQPLPAELAEAFEVHWIGGGKSPQEPALIWRQHGAVFFGDVVRSHASGSLRLLPPEKLQDPERVSRDLKPLLARTFETVLLGDGDNLWTGATQALSRLGKQI